MIEFHRLPDIRGLGYHPDVPPRAWYWRGLDDDVLGRHLCIRCDHGQTATLQHSIADTGEATPSLVWPGPNPCCHIYARLLGWTPQDAELYATRPRRK